MALHLYIFTLFGMLLFPKPKGAGSVDATVIDGNNIGIALTNITQTNSTQVSQSFKIPKPYHTILSCKDLNEEGFSNIVGNAGN